MALHTALSGNIDHLSGRFIIISSTLGYRPGFAIKVKTSCPLESTAKIKQCQSYLILCPTTLSRLTYISWAECSINYVMYGISRLSSVFFLLKNLYADVHGFSRYVETTGHRNDLEGAREATNSVAGVADIRVDRLGDEWARPDNAYTTSFWHVAASVLSLEKLYPKLMIVW